MIYYRIESKVALTEAGLIMAMMIYYRIESVTSILDKDTGQLRRVMIYYRIERLVYGAALIARAVFLDDLL